LLCLCIGYHFDTPVISDLNSQTLVIIHLEHVHDLMSLGVADTDEFNPVEVDILKAGH